MLLATSVELSAPPSPPPSPPSPPSSSPPSAEERDFAPASISRNVWASTSIFPPFVDRFRLTVARLPSSATDTPAAMPSANLPSSPAFASPLPIALVFTLCCDETVILPCVVIALPASIVAVAMFLATVTAASGTRDTDPAPAAFASASVEEFCSAATVRLSGLSTPVKNAPAPNVARVTFLLVATASEPPIPNLPPLTSGSVVSVVPLSSISRPNSSSDA